MMKLKQPYRVLLLLLVTLLRVQGWMPLSPFTTRRPTTTKNSLLQTTASPHEDANEKQQQQPLVDRRNVLVTSLLGGVATWTSHVSPASALVKGNAPPSSKKATSERKCKNVEECQEMAEKLEAERAADAAANAVDSKVTATGVRYRDEQVGSGAEAKAGDDVEVYYKVLKLGKRSYDGLSGEGTVVFSRGYGLEDDEKTAGDKSFVTNLGSVSNIAALNEAIPGMKINGIRRFAIFPEKGWRKPGKQCDGGPGGSGQGGDLRTDYVVVPTATMVAEEACFDNTKRPFPLTYAQQRRMAQRFDQALIMEVQLVKTGSGLMGF